MRLEAGSDGARMGSASIGDAAAARWRVEEGRFTDVFG